MNICAIVLAAGRSRRMGTQKLLLPLGDKPVIAHVVDQLLRSAVVNQVFVVVSTEAERIRLTLEGRDVRIVIAGDTEDMLTSVRAGLRALPKSCDAILVALGDQPSLRSRLIKRLIAAFISTRKEIIVPMCRGKCGHPLLFSARFRKEILTHYDDTGLRGLRQAHPEELFVVKTVASSVLEDMDTPEDYTRMVARMNLRGGKIRMPKPEARRNPEIRNPNPDTAA